MDLELLKENIVVKVIHGDSSTKVLLHIHDAQDEIFYCIKGTGFGVTADGEVELNVGESFIAHAGTMHSIRTDDEIYVTAILIPVDRIICDSNKVRYSAIRKAMASGARTLEDIQKITGACTCCTGCNKELKRILSLACGCKGVSIDTVVNAVKDGADTFEKVWKVTGAGTGCGKCKALLQNIIDTKK